MRVYPKHLPQPEKRWRKDDCGYICYSYASGSVSVLPVEIVRRERPHYLIVRVPSLLASLGGEFAQPFECLVWEHQVYSARGTAEQMAQKLQQEEHP